MVWITLLPLGAIGKRPLGREGPLSTEAQNMDLKRIAWSVRPDDWTCRPGTRL
jgi:hypothetical protein